MKRRAQPSPDAAPDLGADGLASMARPATVRAVQPGPGHATVQVRQCHDALAIDRLRQRGLITDAQHDAALALALAWPWRRRITGRYGETAAGGRDVPLSSSRWNDLVERVPVSCRDVVIAVVTWDREGEPRLSAANLGDLRRGLDALAAGNDHGRRSLIRAAWA